MKEKFRDSKTHISVFLYSYTLDYFRKLDFSGAYYSVLIYIVYTQLSSPKIMPKKRCLTNNSEK